MLAPHYPQMPPSVKNGDNTGRTLSANAVVTENGDITGTTVSGNATVSKKWGLCKIGGFGGITFPTNAAISEKRGHSWYRFIHKSSHP
jgi:hypothetical protein